MMVFFDKTTINSSFCNNMEYRGIMGELKKGEEVYRKYWTSICNHFNKNNLDDFTIKKYCLNNILHVFFNNLIGINEELENDVMGLLAKIVQEKGLLS